MRPKLVLWVIAQLLLPVVASSILTVPWAHGQTSGEAPPGNVPARSAPAAPASPPSGHPPVPVAAKRQEFRSNYLRLESFLDSLNIVEGMTILDLGAGPGYASLLLAEKLKGTGKVVATDIRGDFVDHIREEAAKRGLKNLTAEVVDENGLDELYRRHTYDLVLLSNVYHCLNERVRYFSELRGLLKPGGRLALIMYDQAPLYALEDFSRIADLAKALAAEGPESPFLARLSETTRHLLATRADDLALKQSVLSDFNRLLADPRFYEGFYGDSYFRKGLLSAEQRDFANWLLMGLHEKGVLEQPVDQIDERDLRSVIRLNRLLVASRFGEYLPNGGRGAYLPAGDANRHTSKYVMLRELEQAGYVRASELKLSPYYDAIVMVPGP